MMEKLKDILNKYRFAVLVALAGVVLMLLPAGKQEIEAADTAGEEMSFSLEETERRMAEVLSAMDGVGRVQVMLTLHSGETCRWRRIAAPLWAAAVMCGRTVRS